MDMGDERQHRLVVAGGRVSVGVPACSMLLLLYSQDRACTKCILSELLLFKMKTAKNEKVIFII